MFVIAESAGKAVFLHVTSTTSPTTTLAVGDSESIHYNNESIVFCDSMAKNEVKKSIIDSRSDPDPNLGSRIQPTSSAGVSLCDSTSGQVEYLCD